MKQLDVEVSPPASVSYLNWKRASILILVCEIFRILAKKHVDLNFFLRVYSLIFS